MSDEIKVYEGLSIIPNVGKGLFAARDIAKDEVVAEYLGELLPPDQNPKNERSNLYFKDGYTLCCYDNDLASYANDCIEAPKETRKLFSSLRKYEPFYKKYPKASINAEIHIEEDSHRAFLYARENIKKDEEIFCHYGFSYWFNYEALNFGFEMEKEIQRNGFPDDLFKYVAFHSYVKEFYPQSKTVESTETENGFVVAIKFEDDKGMILNMPKFSKFFKIEPM